MDIKKDKMYLTETQTHEKLVNLQR